MHFDIFTTAFTFHCPPISNLDLEIIDCSDKTMNNLCDSMMDKVMCAANINQYYYPTMFNKTSEFESLGRRNVYQSMERDN